MSQGRHQENAGVRRLPVLHRGSVDYIVDNRLQEFREVSHSRLKCIAFGSAAGAELLRLCRLVDCQNCGNIVVFPPSAEIEEATCRCGERVIAHAIGAWSL